MLKLRLEQEVLAMELLKEIIKLIDGTQETKIQSYRFHSVPNFKEQTRQLTLKFESGELLRLHLESKYEDDQA